MENVTLETLHEQQKKILDAIGNLASNVSAELLDVKEQQLVTNAMLRALEASQEAMSLQLATMTRQFNRMNDRVNKLEDAS